jgi:ATP-dependent DNA helicase RecQ
MSAEAVARQYFGVEELREQQLDAIKHITEGKNVIAVLPTGFGKSLCYQVGSLMLPGFTVVITPLLALCEDQMAFMTAHGVPVVRINSTIDRVEQDAIFKRITEGPNDLKVVYTTPETLQHNVRFVRALRKASAEKRVPFVTIDEAHCVLEWSDFRCVTRAHSHALHMHTSPKC